MDDDLDIPGLVGSQGGSFSTSGDLPNLDAGFSPSLTNLLPADSGGGSGMNDDDLYSYLYGFSPGDLGGSDSTGNATLGGLGSSGLSSNALGSLGSSNSLLGSLGSALGQAGNGLLGAFITNPANAKTAEGQAAVNTQLSLLKSSSLFTYLIIGLVIFLLFGFLERK